LGETCPNCGAELPGEVRFCPSCGTPVAERTQGGEERKLVTLLFADVTGSTSLGEQLDPEQFREVMSSFFAAMRHEIEAEGGTVEKFIGDAVMAAFGVPVAHEDDAPRALRAALRMRRALAELNERLRAAHGVSLAMRVGVNTCEVIAHATHRPEEGMVSGDAANVAARLEQGANPGQILVSERTARGARGFDLRPRGALALKGKERRVNTFELVSQRAASEPPFLGPPLVGRGREVALLESLFDRVVAERRPHLVTVYGDAGVGKSRLVAEVESRILAADPAAVAVSGRCLPYGEGITYWPLAEILKRDASVLDSDPPALAVEKIETLVREMVPVELCGDTVRAAAALAFTVGLEHPDVAFASMDPRQVGSEIVAAWRAYFSAQALRHPTIVVVEDVQWAEPAMLDLLEALAERAEGPLLFLCPARPELTARRPGWGGGRWNFSALLLEPLTADEAGRLLDSILPETGILAPPRDRILERTGGNPFFIEEVVHRLVDDAGAGPPEDRAAELVDLPDTVQAVVAARIDLLGAVEKRILRAAAVVGRVFWAGATAAVTGIDTERIDAALARLEDRRLIEGRLRSTFAGEREFAFRHILTRDVAYDSVPRRERAGLHARVGEWIERTTGERQREVAELLAYHFEEASAGAPSAVPSAQRVRAPLTAKAFRYSLLASEELRARMVLDKAQRLASSALSAAATDADRSLAHEALGLALYQDSRGDEAWEALRRAADLQASAPNRDQAVLVRQALAALEIATRGRGTMRSWLSEADARPYLDLVERELDSGMDGVDRVRFLIIRSFWPDSFRERSLDERSLSEAIDAGESAADLAERIGRPDLASAALDGVGMALQLRARFGRMYPIVERRLRLARQLDDAWEAGDAFAVAAWTAYEVGRYRDAFGFADEGFRIAETGAMVSALHCLDWRALARFRMADWDGLLSDGQIAESLLGDRKERPPPFSADHLAAMAYVYEVRGERPAADRVLQVLKWLEGARDVPAPAWIAWTALTLARRGAFDEAWEKLDRPDLMHLPYARATLLEAKAVLLGEHAMVDPDVWTRSEAIVTEARKHAFSSGLLGLPLVADGLEGRAALQAGEAGQAAGLLRRASNGLRDLEAYWDAARTDVWLADAERAMGNREASDAALGRAVAVFGRIGAAADAERARAVSSS
jgi:class 3 adenylate cyclase